MERSLYKNIAGTMLIFEEVNLDLDLVYRYAWRSGELFGFIKTTWLVNGTSAPCQVELVDGVQNLLPANVSTQTQNVFSVLLDAYKRSELDPETGLGIFALSSNLTDLAEPSEALLATTVAQVGLAGAAYLLSTRQLDAFRSGGDIRPEVDVRGQRGAYLVHTTLHLAPGEARAWHLVADVTQDHAAIARLRKLLRSKPEQLFARVEQDAAANQANLVKLVASADGLQTSQDALTTSHHFANVLFNVLRGGIFADALLDPGSGLAGFHRHTPPGAAGRAGGILLSPAGAPHPARLTGAGGRVAFPRPAAPVRQLPAADLQPPAWRPQPALEPLQHQRQEPGWLTAPEL